MTGERMLVLGAGGIGGLIAGMLVETGHDVTVADQWPDHVEAMLHRGLEIADRAAGDRLVPVRAVHLHELQREDRPFDVVFLAVKSYDTEWTAALAARHLAPEGVVLVCQNGITDARVAAVVGAPRTLGCVVTMTGHLLSPGRANRADTYPIGFRVGELSGAATPRVDRCVEILADVTGTAATDNLVGERWAKLATNCMVNAVSGLSGYTAGEVRTRADTLSVIVHLGAETIRVGRAAGHHVEPVMGLEPDLFLAAASGHQREELEEAIRGVGKATGAHPASMLQDVRKGRRTEIDDLNGFVASRGAELGVATPFNAAAAEIVRSQPVGTLRADPANLTRLIENGGPGMSVTTRLERLLQWISATSVANPQRGRGLLRLVPRLPDFMHRSIQPVTGPWDPVDVRVPDALRGDARNRTDPDAQAAAMRDDPLLPFGKKYPLATEWTTRLIWRVRVPMLPRWLRATAAARQTGRRRPQVAAVGVDPDRLTRELRLRAAELGFNTVGVAAHDPRYSAAGFDPAVSGDRIVVCILEQPWAATQQIPSVHAELGALTTYTAAVNLASELAEFLHTQGFAAEAHDNGGPHLVIPYAVEAGLGQLGLNGQLLTPVAGSRCRVVTISTTAPLALDEPADFGVPALCDACQACVERCPSGAIPSNRRMHRGVEKAKINTKRCLPVVAKVEGCGVCMKVCPVQRYGLVPVLEHFEQTGQVLGRHTNELEAYTWPLTGEFLRPGQKPRLDRDFYTIPGGEPL